MRYMLVLIGDEGTNEAAAAEPSAEEMQAMIEPWNRFGAEIADAGVYVSGDALQPSATATTVKHVAGGDRAVTDGPFAETKEQIGGFYLLECSDLDDALAWAKKVPVREGNSVEVRPVMDYSQFGYELPAEAASAS